MNRLKLPNRRLSSRTIRNLACATILVGCAFAQAPRNVEGYSGVWSTTVTGSSAFIDASTFCGGTSCGGTTTDVCSMIAQALLPGTLPSAGGVVDARGVVSTQNAPGVVQTCNIDPFQGISQSNTKPITVLLPAATIVMGCTWTLPSNTRLLGEGVFTTLQGPSSCSSSCPQSCNPNALIQMGSSGCGASGCAGISIEHLELMQPCGVNPSLSGIENNYAQQSSYVNDVRMLNLGGTGVLIAAPNSGPYTNLGFIANSGTCTSTFTPVCVDIEAQSRGLHGITCAGNPPIRTPPNKPEIPL